MKARYKWELNQNKLVNPSAPWYSNLNSIMIKKLTSLIFLAAVLTIQVSAQKSKLTTGVLAQTQGNNVDAIEKLEVALEKPELLKKEKNVAKAHFYLAKAYLAVSQDTSMAAKFPNAGLKAQQNLKKAIENPEGKKYDITAKLENLNYQIWATLYNKGVTEFNTGKDNTAMELFEAANEANPGHFLTNRMLGSAALMTKDSVKSVEYLKAAIDVFKTRYAEATPEVKDGAEYKQDYGQLSYIFQQLAVILNAQNKTNEALDLLSQGVEMLPEDEDVKRQELAIYQQNPDLFEKAEVKFTSALEKNPKDNNIRLAYASLLERVKRHDDAFKMYEEAYKIDPENIQANYGKAAYYINKAAEVSAKKMEYTKDEEIDKADEEIKGLCEKAYPYVKWLHNAQPNEAEWLSQLVNITPIIGKRDEMTEYAKKLGELNRSGGNK